MTEATEWYLAHGDTDRTPSTDFDAERYQLELERGRAEQALFMRKQRCEMEGRPFVPTDEEQATLDRMERQLRTRLRTQPSRKEIERADNQEMAGLLENELAQMRASLVKQDMKDGQKAATEVAVRNLENRIAELRAA